MLKIEISLNKCVKIHFGTFVFEYQYSFDNYVLKEYQDVVDLGILITLGLKFSLYCKNIAWKTSRRAALIRKCFNNSLMFTCNCYSMHCRAVLN